MPDWQYASPPTRWSRSGQPPFVGRRPQVDALEDAWSCVRRGAGAVVIVAGEAGAGKSRLVAECASGAAASGAAVLVGSCTAELRGAWDPFEHPARVLAEAVSRGRLSAGSETVTDEVVASRLRSIADGGESTGPSTVALAPRQLHQAVAAAVEAASGVAPVVLVLEDLHWAGASALRLLAYLVERTADSPVLILLTLRTRTTDRSAESVDAIARLGRLDTVRRVDLPPLTSDDVADYVVRLGSAASPDKVRQTATMLRRQSGGNPFYLRELSRHLLLGGDGRRAPESLRDAFQAVFRTMPAHMPVLEVAAVLGQEFSARELASVCEAEAARSGEAVDEALVLAERGGLIDLDAPLRFSHGIARRFVLDQIAPNRLGRLHALVAERLESEFQRAPGVIQRLAEHYSGSGSPHHRAAAVRYLVAAAGLAENSLAHKEAASLLRRAAVSTTDDAERDELRLRAARSCVLAGDFDVARELDEEVAAGGDPRRRVRAAIGFEVASWRPGLLGHRAVELLSTALEGIPADPLDPLYVRAMAGLARGTAFTGSVSEAAEMADAAIGMARNIGDVGLLSSVLRTSVHLSFRPSGLLVRLSRAEELSALAIGSGDPELLGAAAISRAADQYARADARGLELADRDLRLASRDLGGGDWEYWAGSVRYAREFCAGRLDSAEAVSRELRERQDEFGSDRTDGPSSLQSYMVRREAARLGIVRRQLSGLESASTHWAPGLLAVYTECGMGAPSRRMFDHQLAGLDGFDRESADWPARLVFLVEAALRLRDGVGARRLRPLMAEYAGLCLASGYFVAVFGSAERYLGALDSLIGSGAARGHFERAVEMDHRMGSRLHVAEALAMHAAHLRRHRTDPAAARSMEARARSIAEPLGLVRVLRMLGGPREEAIPGPDDGLTTRESQVLRLVAAGLGNRAIAASLSISENTAANHVRSILTKVGATNRTQAAIYARDRGMLGPGGVTLR